MSDHPIHIDICMCTFKRPQIAQTLQSLVQMQIPDGYNIAVIIADNDDTDKARDTILKTAHDLNLKTTYVHAPARNISIARNACLDAATAPLALFIDDDEVVDKDWLVAMISRHNETQAPLILGPVKAIYADHHPKWMREQDFHSIHPVWVHGQIITGYTSNLLLDQSIADIKENRFLVELGQSGGEDSHFLSDLHQKGHKIEFAPDAVVREDVADNRATFKWLFNRRFRMGQTHAAMTISKADNKIVTRIKTLTLATLKMLLCGAMALAFFWKAPKCYFWTLRATLHFGVIMSIIGKQDLKQYG